MPTCPEWTDRAARELLGLRNKDGTWGYRVGAEGGVEPTALAALALLADGTAPGTARETAAREAADALAGLQRPDGSLGVSATRPTPGWMTPYAILTWHALHTQAERSLRASLWLLSQAGRTLPKSDDPEHVVGHDTTIVGWPWVADTHSWLEPTALAVLAAGREGLGSHPRVREGLRLVRDRAVVTGGWNYGNKAVFGRPLRPQPAPTGLALLTLAGRSPRDAVIDRGIAYLHESLPGVRASASLGWGVIGLRAWGAVPSEAPGWLAEAYEQVRGRNDAGPKLAILLLAAGRESLGLFGRSEGAPATARAGADSPGGVLADV